MVGGTAKSKSSGVFLGVIEEDLGDQWKIRDIGGSYVQHRKDEVHVEVKPPSTSLASINTLFSWVCMVAGVFGAYRFWPDTDVARELSRLGVNAYIAPLSFIASGLVCGLIFTNFSALLQRK